MVRPPCYDTLPLTVTQKNPIPGDPIRFIDVIELLPTARALHLQVIGCEQVTASATVTGPFTVLASPVVSAAASGFGITELLVWVLFTPGNAGTNANGTLTVNIAETSDSFVVPIVATVISNPSVGTSLVLDQSGSMSSPSGVFGKNRMDILHDSAPLFITLLDPDDGVGVVRFATDATAVTPIVDAGPMIGGAGRLAASTAINGTATDPAGLTAIGDGLESAALQLNAVLGQYDHSATIVFTDGHETADKTIAAAASSVNSRVFAIGLGTADQLNPGALSDIANGTGGYVLLTGNPGPDDQLLLQKYFAQVLAGVTNSVIVVDPTGFVPLGDKAIEKFLLTDADIKADILLLGQFVSVLDVTVIAPDGTVLTAGSGLDEVIENAYRVLRVIPSKVLSPPSAAGVWQVVLTVNRDALEQWLVNLREWLAQMENLDRTEVFLRGLEIAIKSYGIPYTLSVQARSSLRMDVSLSQSSRLPGSTGRLRATLTDSGIPLDHSAVVAAKITDPTGAVSYSRLIRVEPGVYRADIPTTVSGVYQILTSAVGVDLRGTPFTREELRTLAVWARGNEQPPIVINPGGQHFDPCDFLNCLLSNDGIRRFLAQHEIDSDSIRKCVEAACH